MKPSNTLGLQRAQLDRKLKQLRKALPSSPRSGWINAIRTSLGISAQQLANRLDVSRQAIASYEKEEQAGTITFSTLKKVAAAMGCELVIALVPKEPLEKLVKNQAIAVATRTIERTDLHMKLEKQGTSSAFRKKQIKIMADDLVRTMDKRIWDPKP